MSLKKLLLIALAIFMLWILVAGVRIWVFSRRAAVLVRQSKPFHQAGSGTSVLVLGDSLAYGTGTSKPAKSIAGLIGAHLKDAQVVNKAANGKRTAQLASEIGRVVDKDYDIIVVIIGGNDIIHPFENLTNTRKNLVTIYGHAAKRSSHVVALTTGNLKYTSFFPWPLNHYFAHRSQTVRAAAKEAAGQHNNVIYVDMIARNERVPFDHLKEAADHLHLSDDGAQYWFDGILETTNNLEFDEVNN